MIGKERTNEHGNTGVQRLQNRVVSAVSDKQISQWQNGGLRQKLGAGHLQWIEQRRKLLRVRPQRKDEGEAVRRLINRFINF